MSITTNHAIERIEERLGIFIRPMLDETDGHFNKRRQKLIADAFNEGISVATFIHGLGDKATPAIIRKCELKGKIVYIVAKIHQDKSTQFVKIVKLIVTIYTEDMVRNFVAKVQAGRATESRNMEILEAWRFDLQPKLSITKDETDRLRLAIKQYDDKAEEREKKLFEDAMANIGKELQPTG